MRISIGKIEELEQEVTALKNEQPTEFDYQCSSAKLAEAKHVIALIQTERNTLSQVIRILASQGRIDPVMETAESQMLAESFQE